MSKNQLAFIGLHLDTIRALTLERDQLVIERDQLRGWISEAQVDEGFDEWVAEGCLEIG